MSAKVGVITFPGTLDDVDAARAARRAGAEVVSLWHADADIKGVDAVVVPGGFSYGDYLRCGAIASMAPVMGEVVRAAEGGMPVLGICNGFQILCEAGLLPGALGRNRDMHFVCRDEWLRVDNANTAWTSRFESGAEILIPLKSGEGRYMATPDTIERLEGDGRVVFRYVGAEPSGRAGAASANGRVSSASGERVSPNGSTNSIAGVCSENGRVVGLMPHPEHAIDALTGPSDDGLGLFLSALDAVVGV